MARMLGGMAVVLVILTLTAAGCKSASPLSNPFAKQPGETLKSPAEMDELQLKAPPENYTRGETASKSETASNSMAQNGDYSSSSVPGFSAQAEPSSQRADAQMADTQAAAAAPLAQNSPYTADPVKMAMSTSPAAGNSYPMSGMSAQSNPAANNPYSTPAASAADNSAVYPSTGSGTGGNTGVFAPGSIGGY